ncbi:hypothetical protein EHF33_20335 (plasmid) [Deinococcus psychrotolerans]|uniref:Uncharacterized protein n=1 Tax=Deinococcus psychrotolerans TaxID=2489213 RepID=A0A3G8YJ13_9DEIO|nr:hypothetical protein [Deinococcus psychrotolerans]AZI45258.1 hypothetical protein EHF33_20335 [Deinococcus psychrotolerans]
MTFEIVKALQEHRAALLHQVETRLQNDTERRIAAPLDQDQPISEALEISKQLGQRVSQSRWPEPAQVALSQQTGHCGSCSRWAVYPDPADHMGMCAADRRAHGWWDGAPSESVETQATLCCRVEKGRGWRPRKTVT